MNEMRLQRPHVPGTGRREAAGMLQHVRMRLENRSRLPRQHARSSWQRRQRERRAALADEACNAHVSMTAWTLAPGQGTYARVTRGLARHARRDWDVRRTRVLELRLKLRRRIVSKKFRIIHKNYSLLLTNACGNHSPALFRSERPFGSHDRMSSPSMGRMFSSRNGRALS
jgi:hypothetical protein